ncbi:MAG: hypothetical protein GY832_01220 [Chloroflexi bacterium]|nr:hypothetical protein [Chloroflexota bacterium]
MMQAINFEPFDAWPLHWVITLMAAIVIIVAGVRLLYGLVRNRKAPIRRVSVTVLTILAAICLALAAWNPIRSIPADPEEEHLCVVLDVSDSVLRVDGGLEDYIRNELTPVIENIVDSAPEQYTASIVTFRGGVSHDDDFTLASLLTHLNSLDPDVNFAAGDGSDIGAGLTRAGELIARAGGRGQVLLVSDGNDTVGNAYVAAQQLARQGIPIHILPIESLVPELAITAANLPNPVNARSTTHFRGVVYNVGSRPVNVELRISRNLGIQDDIVEHVGREGNSVVSYSLPSSMYHSPRVAIGFEGIGIQFVDLVLVDTDSDTPTHHRRLFTHINRPIHLLAVGGDYLWTEAIPRDFAAIDTFSPDELLPDVNLSQYDSVVISEVSAGAFSSDTLEALAMAVEKDGLGLILINGDHEGASEEDNTILSTYDNTVIAPLLPVFTDPRSYSIAPPPRHVVILIDASDSMNEMGGWKIAKAIEIAQYIVDSQLEPDDRLDVIAFNSRAIPIVTDTVVSAEIKRYALEQIGNITAGGSTDPKEALEMIIDRQMTNCGLIFISDNEFNRDTAQCRPDCRTTVFDVGGNRASDNLTLNDLADPFTVDRSFDPRRIQIPFFEPETRQKSFEKGAFIPLSMARVRGGPNLTIPALNINGAAITYAKDDAELVAVRPKFIDPVLVYGQGGQGRVGVFTGSFDREWIDHPGGNKAIREWIEQTVPYAARDRYTFDVSDDGSRLTLNIEVKSKTNGIPRVDKLDVQIEIPAGTIGFDMIPVQGSPATFEGTERVPRTENTQRATLVVEEAGPDALARAQRIPILIPLESDIDDRATTEASSWGLNADLLEEIAQMGGGQFKPGEDLVFSRQLESALERQPLWPCLISLAAVFYLLAIANQKVHIPWSKWLNRREHQM